MKSFLVDRFTGIGRSSNYIGKTSHHFQVRIEKHINKNKKSNIYIPMRLALIRTDLILLK